MILKTIFAPKWQHRNTAVRKNALQAMDYSTPETQSVFIQVVNTDLDKGVRLLVIKRLLNTDTLKIVTENDIDNLNREAADLRYRQLLAGHDPHGENLELRCKRLENIVDQSILEFIATCAEEPILRLNAVNRLTRQSLLGDIAIDDNDISVREASLEHVVQLSTLTRVAKNSRRRDKHIHALAQSRLDQLKKQQQRPEELLKEAKFCCSQIDALLQNASNNQTLVSNETKFIKLNKELDSVRNQWLDSYGIWDKTLDNRAAETNLKFYQRLKEQKAELTEQRILEEKTAPIVTAKRKLCERLTTKLDEFSTNAAPSESDLQLVETLLKECKQQWQDLESEKSHLDEPNDAQDRLLDNFEGLLVKLYSIRKDIKNYIGVLQQQRSIADTIEKLISSADNFSDTRYKSLKQQWTKLHAPYNYQLDLSLQNKISDALEKISARIQNKKAKSKNNQEIFQQLVKKMGSALEAGQAKLAIDIANNGRNLIKTLANDDKRSLKRQGTLQSFYDALKQIDDLQDWRKWSNEPLKLALCESMEQLRSKIQDNLHNPDYDLNDAAVRIKTARDEWKEISTAEVNQSQELWIRFDEACTAAYEPCHENYLKQAQQRNTNLKHREKACEDLENYYQKIQIQEEKIINWKALENIIHIAQQDWKSLGPVDLKQRQRINKRFYAVLNQLRNKSKSRLENNAGEKQLLINRANSLAQSLDENTITLVEAISTIKQFQANWKTVGTASKDGVLWGQFRKPCDAIFAQRASNIKDKAAQQQAISDQKVRLCESIEKFAQSKDENQQLSLKEIEKIKREWTTLGTGQNSQSMEKRFRVALKAFNKKYQHHISAHKELQQKQLSKYITLCQKIEGLLWDAIQHRLTTEQLNEQVNHTINDWEAIIDDRNRLSRAIHKRFQQCRDLVGKTVKNGVDGIGHWLTSLETSNTKTKETLCLKMEILCGVESPSNAKQARLEYQVSTLASKMLQSNSEDTAEQIEQLLIEWHTSGIINPEISLPLEKRFFEVNKTLALKI